MRRKAKGMAAVSAGLLLACSMQASAVSVTSTQIEILGMSAYDYYYDDQYEQVKGEEWYYSGDMDVHVQLDQTEDQLLLVQPRESSYGDLICTRDGQFVISDYSMNRYTADEIPAYEALVKGIYHLVSADQSGISITYDYPAEGEDYDYYFGKIDITASTEDTFLLVSEYSAYGTASQTISVIKDGKGKIGYAGFEYTPVGMLMLSDLQEVEYTSEYDGWETYSEISEYSTYTASTYITLSQPVTGVAVLYCEGTGTAKYEILNDEYMIGEYESIDIGDEIISRVGIDDNETLLAMAQEAMPEVSGEYQLLGVLVPDETPDLSIQATADMTWGEAAANEESLWISSFDGEDYYTYEEYAAAEGEAALPMTVSEPDAEQSDTDQAAAEQSDADQAAADQADAEQSDTDQAAAQQSDTETAAAENSGEDQTVYTDADTIMAVQDALNTAGYECGTADGIAGSKTYAAMNSYQQDQGLTVTNEITDELLQSLGLK